MLRQKVADCSFFAQIRNSVQRYLFDFVFKTGNKICFYLPVLWKYQLPLCLGLKNETKKDQISLILNIKK